MNNDNHAARDEADQTMDSAGQQNRVFFALSDGTRRHLLERLLRHDGQRQAELTADLDISRQAAVKHLEILEQARLVSVNRIDRTVVYRLNRSPLRTIRSTWIDRFIQSRAQVDCGA